MDNPGSPISPRVVLPSAMAGISQTLDLKLLSLLLNESQDLLAALALPLDLIGGATSSGRLPKTPNVQVLLPPPNPGSQPPTERQSFRTQLFWA